MRIWYQRLICLIAIYACQRLLFIYYNIDALKTVASSDWFWALAEGTRFDLCAIATLNSPLIATHYGIKLLARFGRFSSSTSPRYEGFFDRLLALAFVVVNVPMIIFGVIDSRMFPFTGRRSTLDLFEMINDVQEQALGTLLDYWPVTTMGLAMSFLLIMYTGPRHGMSVRKPISKRHEAVLVISWVVFATLMIRGGWQTKPLSPTHAFAYQPAALANTVLNSTISMLRTPSAQVVHPYQDFASMADVRLALDFPRSENQLASGKNVIVMIVESLACEYMGFFNPTKGYTPFLDNLAKKSVVFKNSFANGRRTIDAVPAIFAALPAWRDQPFVTSQYAANKTRPLPQSLKQHGYSSAFFHGASTGSMHFDVFAKLSGFDSYFGREDFPDQSKHDGQWGIFDEPFLKFAADKMTLMQAPFLAGIFTLSSHSPFIIPVEHQGRFPRGSLPIHESIGYADYSLQKFFEYAATKSWYENTLFVITGDHTSLSDDQSFNNISGRYRVPIIFYDPSDRLPKSVETKVASHIDITPTILGLMGLRFDDDWLLGGPLFDENWPGRFIQFEYGTWLYLDQKSQVTVLESGETSFYNSNDRHLKYKLPESPEPRALELLKASRQYFVNGLLGNTWLP